MNRSSPHYIRPGRLRPTGMAEAGPALVMAAEAVGALLAALIAVRFRRDHQLTRARPLGRLAAGFAFVAVAQAAAFALELATLPWRPPPVPDRLDVLDILFWTYYGASLAGYVSVFSSFGRHPFRWTPVLAPVVLFAGPLLQFVLVIVLFFVVLHAGLNHIARARPGSLQTATGFFLLLLSHFLVLFQYAPLNPITPAGALVGAAGFALLYRAAVRPPEAA